MKNLKILMIEAGQVLHHGTDAFERFQVPRGPAWFTLDPGQAAKWAGWGSVAKADRRVLTVKTTTRLVLLDTVMVQDWFQVCLRFCNDEDATTWGAAKAVAEAGIAGWFGKKEVLISDPTSLEFLYQTPVLDEVLPFGRSRQNAFRLSDKP